MDEIKDKKIYELSIFLPLITVFSAASIYYYEIGYFFYFKIPLELIQIELTKNIGLLFAFISSIIFLSATFGEAIILFQRIFVNEKKRSKIAIVCGFIVALSVSVMYVYLFCPDIIATTSARYLIMSAFAGLSIWAIAFPLREKVFGYLDFIYYLATGMPVLLGPTIIFASMLCF